MNNKSMQKVIVFGSLPLATKVVKDLLTRNTIKLIGIVSDGHKINRNNDPWPDPFLQEFARYNKITEMKLDELPLLFGENELHFGFSCRYSMIFKENIMKIFFQGDIFIHQLIHSQKYLSIMNIQFRKI